MDHHGQLHDSIDNESIGDLSQERANSYKKSGAAGKRAQGVEEIIQTLID
jgi:hypothetical protein